MNATDAFAGALADPRRMRVLGSIDFDHPGLTATLDQITARTAHRTGLPVSLTTLVFDSAQLLAGSHGVTGWLAGVGGTPTEWSFCARAVTSGAPYLVPDTTIDPDQAHNPLVTMDGYASYAGVPVTVGGERIGAHCVLGTRPHHFTGTDLDELRSAADEIAAVIDAYRLF
ncbi:GAF domain-containing protein [Actinoplanes sp. DH11]|uniref:GAF domain-containing protein n=1 Tax=Actinoplanes sp. DH11 TaxID=2857011 RepID=UPI001E48A5CF|nr:GAF domain-containing protein [Actinoplanes sp. DH11]